jgi:hypothetical protein
MMVRVVVDAAPHSTHLLKVLDEGFVSQPMGGGALGVPAAALAVHV